MRCRRGWTGIPACLCSCKSARSRDEMTRMSVPSGTVLFTKAESIRECHANRMKSATDGQVEAVVRVIEELRLRAHPCRARRVRRSASPAIRGVDPSHFENLPGVAEAVRSANPTNSSRLICAPRRRSCRSATPRSAETNCNYCRPSRYRESRPGLHRCRGGAAQRRKILPRRRVQAANSPYAFQGLGEPG